MEERGAASKVLGSLPWDSNSTPSVGRKTWRDIKAYPGGSEGFGLMWTSGTINSAPPAYRDAEVVVRFEVKGTIPT